MLENIKNIMLKSRKILLFSWIVLVFFLLSSDVTFAGTVVDKDFEELKNDFVKIANFVLQVVAVLLAILTYLSTMFLSPEWINGSIFGMNGYFQKIWVLVSNIVYFIFAFILIGIAFMNIVWAWKDKFQLKQALPKFVVGILIVPFSWFIVQFILSISAVLTISAVNLPTQTFSSYKAVMDNVEIPKNCTLDLSKEWKIDEENPEESWFHCDKGGENEIWFWELLKSNKSSGGIFWTIWIYTYGVLGLDNTSKLNKISVESVRNLSDLVVKLVFDVLFVVVYSVLIIWLWLVLMVRWIRIWIYMMFSPVFWLMFFFDKSSGWGSGFFEKFNVKEFISLAMVPVYAMLALSFGILFMFVVGQWITANWVIWDSLIHIGKDTEDGNQNDVISIWGKNDDPDSLKLTIKWAVSNSENITNFFGEIWGATLWLIGSLILKIFGIVILWWAMMTALKSSKITWAVIEPLAQFGNKVWEIAQASPTYLPVFGGQSMQSLSRASWQISWSFETQASKKANKFLWDTWLANLFWLDENIAKLEQAITDLKNKVNWPSWMVKTMRDVIKMSRNNAQLYQDPKYREALFAWGTSMLWENAMNKLKIESSSSINNTEVLKKLMAAIDEKPEYKKLLEGDTVVKTSGVLDSLDNVRLWDEKPNSPNQQNWNNSQKPSWEKPQNTGAITWEADNSAEVKEANKKTGGESKKSAAKVEEWSWDWEWNKKE